MAHLKHRPAVLLAVLAAFLLTGCSPVRLDSLVPLGRIVLSVEQPRLRTLLPAGALATGYSLEGRGSQGQTVSGVVQAGSLTLEDLAPGPWELTVLGKDTAGQSVVAGTQTVTVASGTTTNCQVLLRPVQGQGSLNLRFTWPTDRSIDAVTGAVTSAGGTALPVQAVVTGYEAVLNVTALDAGSYRLAFEFRSGGRPVAVSYQETVLIYAGQPTDGQFALTAAHFFPPSTPAFTDPAPEDRFALLSATVPVAGVAQTHYYHLRAPAGYNSDKTKAYPLVVYLHSFGPQNDVSSLADGSPTATPWVLQALPTSSEHPAFVYVPVCPPPYTPTGNLTAPNGGEWNSPEARAMVVSTIVDLKNRFNIDPSRIYLVGFSMGGAGCWYLGYEYHRATGSRFAAVSRGAGWYLAPSGNPPEPPASLALIQDAMALSPTWIHVGETEGEGFTVGQYDYTNLGQLYGVAGTEFTITRTVGNGLNPSSGDSLESVFSRRTLTTGAESRLSVYRGHGHEDLMYRNDDLVSWLFAQHL